MFTENILEKTPFIQKLVPDKFGNYTVGQSDAESMSRKLKKSDSRTTRSDSKTARPDSETIPINKGKENNRT